MLAAGCTGEMVAGEMERRWGFRPREAHRHAHGWSQDEVAVRFTEIAERLGSDKSLPTARNARPDRAFDRATADRAPMIGTRIGEYERWPSGGRRPSPYVLTLLAVVFGTTVDRLLDYDDYRHLPDQERTVLSALLVGGNTPAAPATPPTAYRAPGAVPLPPPKTAVPSVPPAVAAVAMPLDPITPDPAVIARRNRRDNLLGNPAAQVSPEEEVIMEAAGQSAEFGEWAEATNVGPSALEQLDQDVRRIARQYLQGAPLPQLLSTLRIRNRTFSLIEGRQYPKQTRHLYLVSGRICGLLAWMSGDLGRHSEAETQARTAWLCAELADSNHLRAWVRATQSKLAYWDGRTRESAQLAEDGLRFGTGDSGRVLLASLAARAWARMGQTDEAHRSLGRVQDEREAISGEDEVGGLYGFSEAQQHYLAGTTHLWLHEPDQALRAADRAVWLYEIGDPNDRFYGAESLALIDAATAQLQADELEGATERLRPVLALPPEQRLETFTTRLGEMRDVLRRTRYAASAPGVSLQRQIEDFRAGAVSQFIRR